MTRKFNCAISDSQKHVTLVISQRHFYISVATSSIEYPKRTAHYAATAFPSDRRAFSAREKRRSLEDSATDLSHCRSPLILSKEMVFHRSKWFFGYADCVVMRARLLFSDLAICSQWCQLCDGKIDFDRPIFQPKYQFYVMNVTCQISILYFFVTRHHCDII